jgi:hypothetical protein
MERLLPFFPTGGWKIPSALLSTALNCLCVAMYTATITFVVKIVA